MTIFQFAILLVVGALVVDEQSRHLRTAVAFVPATPPRATGRRHHHRQQHDKHTLQRGHARIPSGRVLFMSSAPSAAAPSLPDGLVKTVSQQGSGAPLRIGDIATVKYSCYVPDNPKPFAKASKQKIVVGDNVMIEGWEKALRTMQVGERAVVRVTDPNLGYGAAGVPPLIPGNSCLELDLEVLDAQAPTANIDFDSLATADMTPRTATDIAAAFERKQAARAAAAASQGAEKEGLEGMIEKVKSFYFFGLFEGETGETPPWFLRPSITFPLAFAIVGLTFYVSFLGGAITERGAQGTDELDEIILSSTAVLANPALAVTAFFNI